MNFKEAFPSTLKLVAGFEESGYFKFGKYTLIAFYPTKSGVYDLSFGNNQPEAKNYLTPSQVAIAAYDETGKFLTVLNSNNFSDVFEFNGTAVIIGPDNIFWYFNLQTLRFVEKRFSYPFKTGKGKTQLNEVTEDVAIITHNYYAKTMSSDLAKMYKAFVDQYNSQATKKLGYLATPRRSEYHQFDVNVMINKDFEVEDVERYWLPVMNYGWNKYFVEASKMDLSKILVP